MRKRMIFGLTAALATALLIGCGSAQEKSKELSLLTYPEYIPDAVIEGFEEAYDCKVKIDYVNSYDEHLTKAMAEKGGGGYDVINPNIIYISALREGGYIQELDLDSMSNYQYVDPKYLIFPNEEDKKYAVPYLAAGGYQWIYNPETCPIEITCVDDLLKPEMEGQIVAHETAEGWIAFAMAHLGLNPNSHEENDIAAGAEWLKQLKKNIKVFDGATPSTSVINGECSVALSLTNDVSVALLSHPELSILKVEDYPFETTTESFAVTAATKNKELAEAFINYIHSPEVYAICLETYPSLSCNIEAVKYTGDNYAQSAELFDIPEGSFVYGKEELGDAAILYTQYWSEVLNSN